MNRFEVYALDADNNKTLLDSMTVYQGTAEDFAQQDQAELTEANEQAIDLPIRKNKEGEELILRMIVPKTPAKYADVAQFLKTEWRKSGIGLDIQVLENEDFSKN
ncbi:hypothetical protein IPJ72_04015 [Candidatus Peregrinibacteria bacterium]|nr:MAG: hypothetical protein IPJ72_04015 [Candidatus Peregrinibacteria bacterium]